MIALFAFTLALAPATAADRERLAEAERQFAAGIESRHDSQLARGHFSSAAKEYDKLWHSGAHTAALSKNRARAHRLAGNLPTAIAALHEGLAVARFDRSLQQELEDARSAVAYPSEGLAAECRLPPSHGIGARMSPFEACLIASSIWFGACLGAARLAMTRVPGWLFVAGACLVGLASLGGFWWHDAGQQSRENERPLIIVNREHALKIGNGDLWPDRVNGPLPPGTEARELTRRGGWIQVELASGTAGWIPESHAISPDAVP